MDHSFLTFESRERVLQKPKAGSGCVAALDAQHYLEHHGW